MRISQYVYFVLRSEAMPAAEISAYLGMEPDKVRVRGSDSADPPRPRIHAWEIECNKSGLRVDDQILELLDRLAPVADRIRALVDAGEIDAQLQVVRYFDDEDGEEETFDDPTGDDSGHMWEKVSGQHQLLGWHLEHHQLELLVAMGADIDADEYG